MISTRAKDPATRLTGERPRQGVTPDSLLALHDAGYEAVIERLGSGRVLDVGCGEGFETLRLAGEGRSVLGVDYELEVAHRARGFGQESGPPEATRVGGGATSAMVVACMDALELALATASFDAVCSSHVIEHFTDPAAHVAEAARILRDDGRAFFLTPNAPADFENPFHVHLFERPDLVSLLDRHFGEVWVGGLDASPAVKADFAARRAKAERLLRLDIFDLRHRMPRGWYVGLYTRLLPVAYRLLAARDSGGATGITAGDWFVTDAVDPTTLVLFATCGRPRRGGTVRS